MENLQKQHNPPVKRNDIYTFSDDFDIIDAAFNDCGEGFIRWTIIKYVKRAGLKITGDKTFLECKLQDLNKAKHCIERWIQHIQEKKSEY